MKINSSDIYIRVIVCCMCLILISISVAVALYEWIVNWGIISSIFLGLYLYSIYRLCDIMADKPVNQPRHLCRRSPDALMRQTVANEK
ncbi:hypothetical protein [Nitrosomonas sp.]|jgi:hypothetical protein|uniref:hypothetical protein n=1 Tax=Nitrosomonas sp. TaxID=42353 RepID=UPI0035B0F967